MLSASDLHKTYHEVSTNARPTPPLSSRQEAIAFSAAFTEAFALTGLVSHRREVLSRGPLARWAVDLLQRDHQGSSAHSEGGVTLDQA